MHTETDNDLTDTAPAFRGWMYQVLGVILFAAMMAWAVQTLLDPGTLPIRQVRIEGEFKHLSGERLQMLVSDTARGNFFNLDVTAVRNALLAEPWVRNIAVQRVWPDTILVLVTEQTAVARWNETGLLNKAGQYFAPEPGSVPEGLPLLQGPEGTQALLLEKYFALEKMLRPLGLQPQELILNERRAWLLVVQDGVSVELGRENFDERSARFAQLVAHGLGAQLGQIKSIDMRYPNGYAVLWKEGVATTSSATGAL